MDAFGDETSFSPLVAELMKGDTEPGESPGIRCARPQNGNYPNKFNRSKVFQ